MAAVIIRSKELVKEVFDFLHNEYILINFPEIKILQKKFLRNLVLKKFRYFNVTKTKRANSFSLEYKKFDENDFEKELESVKKDIEKGTLVTEIIFETLMDLNLDMELDEDLYYKKSSFIDIYKVFEIGYTYLED